MDFRTKQISQNQSHLQLSIYSRMYLSPIWKPATLEDHRSSECLVPASVYLCFASTHSSSDPRAKSFRSSPLPTVTNTSQLTTLPVTRYPSQPSEALSQENS